MEGSHGVPSNRNLGNQDHGVIDDIHEVAEHLNQNVVGHVKGAINHANEVNTAKDRASHHGGHGGPGIFNNIDNAVGEKAPFKLNGDHQHASGSHHVHNANGKFIDSVTHLGGSGVSEGGAFNQYPSGLNGADNKQIDSHGNGGSGFAGSLQSSLLSSVNIYFSKSYILELHRAFRAYIAKKIELFNILINLRETLRRYELRIQAHQETCSCQSCYESDESSLS